MACSYFPDNLKRGTTHWCQFQRGSQGDMITLFPVRHPVKVQKDWRVCSHQVVGISEPGACPVEGQWYYAKISEVSEVSITQRSVSVRPLFNASMEVERINRQLSEIGLRGELFVDGSGVSARLDQNRIFFKRFVESHNGQTGVTQLDGSALESMTVQRPTAVVRGHCIERYTSPSDRFGTLYRLHYETPDGVFPSRFESMNLDDPIFWDTTIDEASCENAQQEADEKNRALLQEEGRYLDLLESLVPAQIDMVWATQEIERDWDDEDYPWQPCLTPIDRWDEIGEDYKSPQRCLMMWEEKEGDEIILAEDNSFIACGSADHPHTVFFRSEEGALTHFFPGDLNTSVEELKLKVRIIKSEEGMTIREAQALLTSLEEVGPETLQKLEDHIHGVVEGWYDSGADEELNPSLSSLREMREKGDWVPSDGTPGEVMAELDQRNDRGILYSIMANQKVVMIVSARQWSPEHKTVCFAYFLHQGELYQWDSGTDDPKADWFSQTFFR